MKKIKIENEALRDFYFLSDYLKSEGKIKDSENYKRDFSAFLSYISHIKAYDFVSPFCMNKKILDIGCFIGYGEKWIAKQAREIVAIDSNSKAIEFARQNRNFSNVEFKKIDARKLPFHDETFDIVIAFQLIEHISPNELSKFLLEVRRVLKMGGIFFITTPNRKFRLLPFQRPFNPEHFQEFTTDGLERILKKIFMELKIEGIRAKTWIENIEKERIHKSPFRAYIYYPIFRYLITNLPERLRKSLREVIKKKYISQNERIEKFNSLFQKFSMEDFYLENRKNTIDKSMDLFAICKK